MNKGPVLLVEDNDDDEFLSRRVLNKSGFSDVVVASDGVVALEYLGVMPKGDGSPAGEFPRLILLDLKLPRVDGIEVLQAIKGSDRASDIPIIVLSSSRDEKEMDRCQELGVVNYLLKPLKQDDLMSALSLLGLNAGGESE